MVIHELLNHESNYIFRFTTHGSLTSPLTYRSLLNASKKIMQNIDAHIRFISSNAKSNLSTNFNIEIK